MTVAWPWLRTGELTLTLALSFDPVSLALSAVVLIVSAVILVYSLAYVRPDEGRIRFFATMASFVAAMLLLVLAGSLITLFVAWELVGLASYLLIGHRREDGAASEAAMKAFLTTRTADLAFLAGIALTVVTTASDALDAPLRTGASMPLIGALFLIGALGKSAQLPFSAWLPAAMHGPTPVSALLHSATMVAAGAYLLVRLFPLFEAAGLLPAIAFVGLATALFAALAALAQTDLKRVLAYSTIAQLAEMVAAVGLGAPLAALLLLIAHAFYKSSLFLVAGELEHAAGTTEMARARAHRLDAKSRLAFAISALALAGMPVSIAFSPRDAVLSVGIAAGVVPAAALVLIAVLTGAYIARALRLTFTGSPARAVRAEPLLSVPALALAIGVTLVGVATSPLLGAPLVDALRSVLGPDHQAFGASALGIGAGLVGIVLGWRWSTRPTVVAPAALVASGLDRAFRALATGASGVFASLAYLDRVAFDRAPLAVAGGAGALRTRFDATDHLVFDAAASAIARRSLALFDANARGDRRLVNAAFDRGAALIALASERGRLIQTGLLENYLVAIGGWVLALVGLGVAFLAGAAR